MGTATCAYFIMVISMSELISVIIPVYNQQETLRRSLASLVEQTYRPLEVIIVDDGSTQEVRTFLPDILSLGFFVGDRGDGIPLTVIRQDNAGAPAARNRGLQAARGSYVIFWDADIIAKPMMLQTMYTTLQQHQEASFAYANFYFGKKKMPGQPYEVNALKKRNFIPTASLIRRNDVVLFDERLKRFQDWDLWLTMAEEQKYGVWIDAYLNTALVHKHGMSSWLPSIAYRTPWKYLPWWYTRVKKYEQAKEIIIQKHQLPTE